MGPILDAGPRRELVPAELTVTRQMAAQAKDAGVALAGSDRLLKALTTTVLTKTVVTTTVLTKTVTETLRDEEVFEHLGCDEHTPQGTQPRRLAPGSQGHGARRPRSWCAGWRSRREGEGAWTVAVGRRGGAGGEGHLAWVRRGGSAHADLWLHRCRRWP